MQLYDNILPLYVIDLGEYNLMDSWIVRLLQIFIILRSSKVQFVQKRGGIDPKSKFGAQRVNRETMIWSSVIPLPCTDQFRICIDYQFQGATFYFNGHLRA